jgi:hypothetical protein
MRKTCEASSYNQGTLGDGLEFPRGQPEETYHAGVYSVGCPCSIRARRRCLHDREMMLRCSQRPGPRGRAFVWRAKEQGRRHQILTLSFCGIRCVRLRCQCRSVDRRKRQGRLAPASGDLRSRRAVTPDSRRCLPLSGNRDVVGGHVDHPAALAFECVLLLGPLRRADQDHRTIAVRAIRIHDVAPPLVGANAPRPPEFLGRKEPDDHHRRVPVSGESGRPKWTERVRPGGGQSSGNF